MFNYLGNFTRNVMSLGRNRIPDANRGGVIGRQALDPKAAELHAETVRMAAERLLQEARNAAALNAAAQQQGFARRMHSFLYTDRGVELVFQTTIRGFGALFVLAVGTYQLNDRRPPVPHVPDTGPVPIPEQPHTDPVVEQDEHDARRNRRAYNANDHFLRIAMFLIPLLCLAIASGNTIVL